MYFHRVVDDALSTALCSPSMSSTSDVAAAASAWLLQSMTSSHDVTMTSLPVAESGFAAALRKLAQHQHRVTHHATSSLSPACYQPPCRQYRSVQQPRFHLRYNYGLVRVAFLPRGLYVLLALISFFILFLTILRDKLSHDPPNRFSPFFRSLKGRC